MAQSDFTIAERSYVSSLARRFWGFVPIGRADECWPWSGARNRDGYPTISNFGRSLVGTRLMREFIDGEPVPSDRLVCHSCDNPPCVNPNHLWVGTHWLNAQDMIAKGRSRRNRNGETK